MKMVKDNPEAKELFSKKIVENTPFVIITDNEKNKSFATFSKYKITEDFDTIEECENHVKTITWNRLIQIIALVNEILKDK